jgi:hypothetical protein
MNKKVIFSSLLVCLLALSLIMGGCDNGTSPGHESDPYEEDPGGDNNGVIDERHLGIANSPNSRNYEVGEALNTKGMRLVYSYYYSDGEAVDSAGTYVDSGWTLGLASNRGGTTDYKDVQEGYVFTQKDKTIYSSGFYLIVKYEGLITWVELKWRN